MNVVLEISKLTGVSFGNLPVAPFLDEFPFNDLALGGLDWRLRGCNSCFVLK